MPPSELDLRIALPVLINTGNLAFVRHNATDVLNNYGNILFGNFVDMNGDGYLDVAFFNSSYHSPAWAWLQNFGNNSFSESKFLWNQTDTSTIQIQAVDLDRDGFADFVICQENSVCTWRRNVNLTFEDQLLCDTYINFGGINVFDADADGNLDIVGHCERYLGFPVSPVQLIYHSTFPFFPTQKDLDGDGKPEFISKTNFGQYGVLMWERLVAI
jgi:hypothetical protein